MEDAVHAVPETGMQKASVRRKSVDDGGAKYVFHGSGPPGRMPTRQYRKGFRTRMALSPIEASAIDGGIDRGTACRRPDRKGSEGLTTWRCLRGSTGGWHRMPVRAPVTDPSAPVSGQDGRTGTGCQVLVARQVHASVRVGSAAMPAPFAFAGRRRWANPEVSARHRETRRTVAPMGQPAPAGGTRPFLSPISP